MIYLIWEIKNLNELFTLFSFIVWTTLFPPALS
jgi:hypothetical protein